MRPNALAILPALALALTARGTAAQVQTSTSRAVGLSSQGASLWGSGPTSFSSTLTRSAEWNVGRRFDLAVDGLNLGISGGVSTAGMVGFSARLGVSGGTLATTVATTHDLIRISPQADVVAREAVRFKSAWTGSSVSFASRGPVADASLRAFGTASFDVHAEVCYVVDCESGGVRGLVPYVNQELLGYNSASNRIRVLGQELPVKAFPYGQEISVPAVPGTSVTLYQPDLAIAGVGARRAAASSTSSLFSLGIDPISAMVQAALGDIPCITGCFLAIGEERVGFKQFASVFEPTLKLRQELDVLAQPFTAFDFDRAVRYRVGSGAWNAATRHFELPGWETSFEIEVPNAGSAPADLVMTSTLGATARVTNRTYLVLDPHFRTSVMEVDLPGSAADFGPLWEKIYEPTRPWALPIFDEVFEVALGQAAGASSVMTYGAGRPPASGFGPPSAPPADDGGEDGPPPPPTDIEIVPAGDPAVTPEPATLTLLGAGLLALGAAAARRR